MKVAAEVMSLQQVVVGVRDRLAALRRETGLRDPVDGGHLTELEEIAWGAHRNAEDLHGDLEEIAEILNRN